MSSKHKTKNKRGGSLETGWGPVTSVYLKSRFKNSFRFYLLTIKTNLHVRKWTLNHIIANICEPRQWSPGKTREHFWNTGAAGSRLRNPVLNSGGLLTFLKLICLFFLENYKTVLSVRNKPLLPNIEKTQLLFESFTNYTLQIGFRIYNWKEMIQGNKIRRC